MKRAALFVLLVVGPLALLLFPALRRSLARRSRAALLVVAGVFLVGGGLRFFAADGLASLTPVEKGFAVGGYTFLAVAFALVLRDALRRR